MKKYVMLVNGIVGMGGGQMYTKNKLSYMRDIGWEVLAFSGHTGEIVIPELREYEGLIEHILISSPLIYPNDTVESVLEHIAERIGSFDEAVIESGSGHMALWGELLAKRLNCKHMVHLLEERPDLIIPSEYLDFYRFKLKRRELSGIMNKSMKILFRNSAEINEDNSFYLPSVCSNVVSDTQDSNAINIPDEGITMGCIGRLEKKYVQAATDAFATVAKKHPDVQFNIVYIGASDSHEHEERIRSVLDSIPNVTLLMPGYVFPIPRSVFQRVDVFVSSSGSASVSYRNGCPTISIDGRDNMAIGVMGYTTTRSLYREDEEKQDPADLLEAIIFKGYLVGKKYECGESRDSLDVLKLHLDFLNASSKEKRYFDVAAMKPAGKDKKKLWIRMMLGTKGYIRFHDKGTRIISNLRKKCAR